MRVLLVFVLVCSACLRNSEGECAGDGDCFRGEACFEGLCRPADGIANNNLGESCDPSACESEWTEDVACRSDACVVLSCRVGADLCAAGCCPVMAPPDGSVDIGSADLRVMDVELDPRGFPEIAWLNADTLEVQLTTWTGRGWETNTVLPVPEPSLAFDLEYHGDVRTLTYLESFGGLYHARQDADGAWTSTKVMDAPEPLDLDDPRFFFRMHYAGRGTARLICALFGNVEAGDSPEPSGEIPDLYVAQWDVDHWESQLLESQFPVRRVCSVAYDDLERPHVAYSIVDTSAYVRHATLPLGETAWVVDVDDTRIGVLTTNEALQVRDNEVHIFTSTAVQDANDMWQDAIYDYFRNPDGTWGEQAVHVAGDPQRRFGAFDAGVADGRIEILLGVIETNQGTSRPGRLVSTQSRTWGALELFETGNLYDAKGAVGPDRHHVFTQPAADTRQLNYFSQEAP